MSGRWLAVGALLLAAGPVAGQISSPPPAAARANSGTPLSETFTPDTLFPKKQDPPPPPAAGDPSSTTTPPGVGAGADGGLFPTPPPPRKIWAGSADLGLNGASGNSELVNIRAGWNLRRRTEGNVFSTDLQYVYSQQDHSTKTNQALFNTRDEILFPNSKWYTFTAGQLEYDELRAYRFRVGSYAGTGFVVFDQPGLAFKLRSGAGATREFGTDGNQDRWVPELLFGYDFRYKFNDRSTFVSVVDFYPRAPTFSQFRARARAAYEFILDPATGTILRLGVQERYDSDPGNAKRNDLNYFATIGLKF